MEPGNVSRYKPELTPKENSLFRVILLRYFVAMAYKSVAEIGRIVAMAQIGVSAFLASRRQSVRPNLFIRPKYSWFPRGPLARSSNVSLKLKSPPMIQGSSGLGLRSESASQRRSVTQTSGFCGRRTVVTSMRWELGRRALPIFWRAYDQRVGTGRMSRYESAVIKRACRLVFGYVSPRRVRLAADRGFADGDLFDLLNELKVRFVIRGTGCVKVCRRGRWVKPEPLALRHPHAAARPRPPAVLRALAPPAVGDDESRASGEAPGASGIWSATAR